MPESSHSWLVAELGLELRSFPSKCELLIAALVSLEIWPLYVVFSRILTGLSEGPHGFFYSYFVFTAYRNKCFKRVKSCAVLSISLSTYSPWTGYFVIHEMGLEIIYVKVHWIPIPFRTTCFIFLDVLLLFLLNDLFFITVFINFESEKLENWELNKSRNTKIAQVLGCVL